AVSSHPWSSSWLTSGIGMSVAPGSSDGAHWGAIPFVPWAQLTTGNPLVGVGPCGTTTMPVTGTDLWSSASETYITRYAVPWSPGTVTGSDLIKVPGPPAGRGVGT